MDLLLPAHCTDPLLTDMIIFRAPKQFLKNKQQLYSSFLLSNERDVYLSTYCSLWYKDKAMPVVSWPAVKWKMPTGFSGRISLWVYPASTCYLQPGTAQAHTTPRSALERITSTSVYKSIPVRITAAAKTRHVVTSEQVNNHKRNDNSVFMFVDWIILMVTTKSTQTSWTCFVMHIL